MALVLLTIMGERTQEDLALTDNLPLAELIPAIVERCVPDASSRTTARWVVGVPGRPALPMTQTLLDCGIRDGAKLYLRDTASPVPPPPPDPVPSPPVAPTATVPRLDVAATLAAQKPVVTRRLPVWLAAFLGVWCAIADAVVIRLTGTFLISSILALAAIAVLILLAIPNGPFAPKQPQRAAPAPAYPGGPLPQSPATATAVPAPASASDGPSEAVTSLIETFLFDLGKMLTGETVPMAYCSQNVAAYLEPLLAPLRARKEWISPQFGGTVDVTVTHPPQRPGDPLVASVTVNDLSVRHLANREIIAPPQRTVVYTLVIDEASRTILDLRITSSAGTWP